MGRMMERIEAGTPYFIAEMSANHCGDLGIALKLVEAAAKAGADCLKIQTYTADTITLDCNNEYFRIHDGLWDGYVLHDLYSKASLPWEWHRPISEKCRELNLDFLSTPFDESAVDFLEKLGSEAYKIASFELTHIPLIEYAAAKGKTMLISTGMGTLTEIQEAIDACHRVGNHDVVLLKCCSQYPANTSNMNLASIPELARCTGCHVGLSDHSLGYLADVVAASLGARVFEKHFCLSRYIDSADVAFSMTPDEFLAMKDSVNDAVAAVGRPTFGPSESEMPSLRFRRSCFATAHIAEGEIFTRDNTRIVRPSDGAHPRYYRELLGEAADRCYEYGDPIVWGEEKRA